MTINECLKTYMHLADDFQIWKIYKKVNAIEIRNVTDIYKCTDIFAKKQVKAYSIMTLDDILNSPLMLQNNLQDINYLVVYIK